MGNTASEVTSGAKKQAASDDSAYKMYSLMHINKSGKLVDLMREAYRKKDFTGIDDTIRELVLPFLYNNGEGKMIPISRIIRMRNSERPLSKRLPSAKSGHETSNPSSQSKPSYLSRCLKLFCCLLPCRSASSKVASHGDSPPEVTITTSTKSSSVEKEKEREVCWKLEERGACGETVLHLALICATVFHLDLARRLVRLFPKIVNDIYINDEYYGEAPLHFAIVNEDPSMVKFLLDHGADVSERAIGNFFIADDQKKDRIDRLEHEAFELPIETNYSSHVYWGEYPLAFAACLELEDCYRLLLAKQANPDWQDSNGNTVAHMCVIMNKMEMFDFAYENGAQISIKNNQGLTPLALAAKLTRTELFFHILNIQRQIYWSFAEIVFAAYHLDEIDSIDIETGEVNETSALTVITFGEELGHLDLMSGVIMELLREKWNKFAREQFFGQIKMFLLYFVLSMVTFILRPSPEIEPEEDLSNTSFTLQCNQVSPRHTSQLFASIRKFICWGSDCVHNAKDANQSLVQIVTTEPPMDKMTTSNLNYCYLWRMETAMENAIRALELATFIGALLYTLSFIREAKRLGLQMFLQTWSKVPGRVMFGISCLLILAALPVRLVCDPRTEDRLVTLAMFFTPMHFLFFCRGFKAVGPFVIMIYKMIVSDLLRFVIIYLIFVAGFAQAFFIIFRSHKSPPGNANIYFSNVIDSFMTMFLMSINDFADAYGEFDNTDHPTLAKFLFLVYMILVSVLLVNMLIAMMGHTYEDIASRPNEWLRQWARIVLAIERSMSKEERAANQKKYSTLRDGQKVFISKWETTEEEREEIEKLKELEFNNRTNRMRKKKV